MLISERFIKERWNTYLGFMHGKPRHRQTTATHSAAEMVLETDLDLLTHQPSNM